MTDMISREAAIAVAASCPDSHWGPWIVERIRALPAVQPRVKPLVWEDRGATVDHQFKATTAFGVYYVERDKSGLFNWWAPALRGKVQAHTLQAAKAAAQADYEARTLSALEPAVQPDAQCCMCGKKGLSTKEDGGPECELHDGRWVCSENCWNDALEPSAAAIREAALREALAELASVELFGRTPQDTHAAMEQCARGRDAVRALLDKPAVQPSPRRATGPIDPEAGFATTGAEARWIEDVDAGVYDVQPDAGAIREAALREAAKVLDARADYLEDADKWGGSKQYLASLKGGKIELRNAAKSILALIDSPGKEVMPIERPVRVRPTDTAPAGLSAGGGADWQPIETAPKDGIAFLGYWPDVSDFGGADNACEVRTWWNETEQRYESPFETGCGDHNPTHWRPRPAPPATEGGA